MRNNLTFFLFLCGALGPTFAFAETASETLTRIEAETLVMKAREKQLEVQSNILAKEQDIATRQQMRDRLTNTASTGDPVIRSIEGIGTRLYAALQMGDGSLVDVQVGETLSNGMKVVSIRPNEVIVENAMKRRTRLSAAAPQQPLFNPGSAGMAIPPIPLLPVPAPRAAR